MAGMRMHPREYAGRGSLEDERYRAGDDELDDDELDDDKLDDDEPPVQPYASRTTPHLSSRILIYQSLFSFLEGISSRINPGCVRFAKLMRPTVFFICARMTTVLRRHYETMSAEDSISALVKSRESRTILLKLSSEFGVADDPKVRDALREDERRLAAYILSILESKSSKESVFKLDGDPAQSFLDVVQNVAIPLSVSQPSDTFTRPSTGDCSWKEITTRRLEE
ncbi:hypothetical protein C8J57DRAFT_167844 [Mycena rebaudengoi]|nr:hypothetical protein C8J57DRAFT_167844 [Mycena rebaudengoi]